MRRIALAAAAALFLTSASALAQGVAPGGPIGGSTGIGSGLGGVTGTGPSWPNGTNQAPQPSIPSIPPGGYASPAPSSSYTAPCRRSPRPRRPHLLPPRQPSEPFAASAVRPPATIPLVLPERPNGSLVFVKGCWRTDNLSMPHIADRHLVLRRQGRRPLPLIRALTNPTSTSVTPRRGRYGMPALWSCAVQSLPATTARPTRRSSSPAATAPMARCAPVPARARRCGSTGCADEVSCARRSTTRRRAQIAPRPSIRSGR